MSVITSWHDYFVMVGGGSAALTGLVVMVVGGFLMTHLTAPSPFSSDRRRPGPKRWCHEQPRSRRQRLSCGHGWVCCVLCCCATVRCGPPRSYASRGCLSSSRELPRPPSGVVAAAMSSAIV